MTCFQNQRKLIAEVRPSPGAATPVSQELMEFWKTCGWRTWLWPRTATLRILKTRLRSANFAVPVAETGVRAA
jgi:hypothetical protein